MTWELITKHAALVPLLAMLCPQVHANSELADFTEEDLFIDIPQVISATHLSQKLTEAPASITIIDKEMIQASGALKISDLFRLVPGMQAYDVHTNKSGVAYHGMTNDFPNKLEVMINGRSVYLPLLATVAWETIGISLYDIDYIEVVRGANVPTQGSNAFLGAINIITRSPLKDQNSELRVTAGDLNTRNYSIRHAGSSDLSQYALTAGHMSNDGIERYKDEGLTKYINLASSFTPSLTDNIDLELGFNNGYASRGDGDKLNASDADFLRRTHTSNYQMISWNSIANAETEYKLTYYHNYLNLEGTTYTEAELAALVGAGNVADTLALNPLGIYKDSEHGEMDLHDLSFLTTKHFSQNSNLVTGIGTRFQRVKSEALFQSADWHEETSWRLFGNWEYKLGKSWVFNTGAMYEYSNNTHGALSPRLAANYLISPDSSIRAAYTHAHRMPSLLDRFGQYTLRYPPIGGGPVDVISRPNDEVVPEENSSFEIGYLKLWPQTKTQFDLRVFYEDITHAIDSYYVSDVEDTNDGRSRSQSNTASWINRGLEFQVKTSLPLTWDTDVIFNYGYNNPKGIRDRGPGIAPRTNTLDTRAPNHTASILFSTKPSESSLIGLSHYYMDHTEWLEGYSSGSPRNNYTRTDLTIRKTFPLDTDNALELSLIIQNLFDKKYSEFYKYNEFDRRSYIQLKFEY